MSTETMAARPAACLSDVTDFRRRARQQIEEGAVMEIADDMTT